MDMKPIQKKVDELSLEKIRCMAENSLEYYRPYKQKEIKLMRCVVLAQECLIVLRLCKEIEELKNGNKKS